MFTINHHVLGAVMTNGLTADTGNGEQILADNTPSFLFYFIVIFFY
jgi:hypothetical protein